MILIDGTLYLRLQDMVEAGFKEGSLLTAKSKGTKCYEFANDPADKRKVIVKYESLSDEHKNKIITRFGNPYDLVARQPILEMVVQNAKAHEYFRQYRYGKNEYLTIETVNKYTRAASWLDMLFTVQEDRSIIKKGLGLSIPEFYLHAGQLIKSEILNGKSKTYAGIHMLPGNFPSTYQRLLEKVKAYKASDYGYLIDPMYGNKLAAKIGKTEEGFDEELERKQIAVIRKVASMHTNFDAAQVAKLSNIVFKQNGWCEIGSSRMYQLMQENKVLLTPGRRGRRAFNNTMAMQIKREASQFPTDYWTLDGWTVELLYQDHTGYSNRLVMVVVLDAAYKYPVGYAIGDRENSELIKEANRNAITHMKELFGDYYYPYQLQSDRYALKSLTPFYQAVSHLHTPAAVGNAKAKIIEPYFKYLNKEYCQLHPNWSGFNVDAKKDNQVNREMLDLIKKSFPTKDGVINQIVRFMTMERSKKIAAYREAWQAMPEEEKNVLSPMDRVMVFGSPVGEPNHITGEGIVKAIGNSKITYDCFDQTFRNYYNIKWNIIADTENLDYAIAVSPDYKLRFLLEKKMLVPMGIRRTTQEHIEYRDRVEDFNKTQRENIIETYAEDAAIAREVIRNTPLSLDSHEETALKLMFTINGQQKENIQNAKRLQVAQKKEQKREAIEQKEQALDWERARENYLNGKTDFNQYLD